MRYIVIISALVVIIHLMDQTGRFLSLLSFHPGLIMRGEVWRLVTWIFLPFNGNLFFTAIALYFYHFIGSTLEREWGTPKFTVYYIFGILLNIIYGFLSWLILSRSIDTAMLGLFWYGYFWLTPFYLNLSMFFAFAALFPDHRILLFFIIPVKMKWMALINAGIFVYSLVAGIIAGQYVSAFLPLVAIFNFIVICGGEVLDYIRPYASRRPSNVINFKKAAKTAQRKNSNQNYRHKCAVCGRTDTDSPGLDFRYCSRCNGYHCFCVDHINNHVHFR